MKLAYLLLTVIIAAGLSIWYFYPIEKEIAKNETPRTNEYTLKIEFLYNNGKISILGMELADSYVPKRLIQTDYGHTFAVLSRDNQELYSFKRRLFERTVFENFDDKSVEVIEMQSYKFYETFPYNKNSAVIQLKNPQGKIILNEPISKYLK